MWAWSSLWFPRYPWRYATMEGSDRWGGPEGSTVSWLWKSDWKSFRNIHRQEHQLLFNPDIIWTFKGMQPALLFSFHPWKTCWRQLHTKPEETLVLFLVFVFFASKIFSLCFVRPVCSLALPIGDWLLHRPNDPWHTLNYPGKSWVLAISPEIACLNF